LWYYGVRYKEGCTDNDLWKTYFTSSKLVKQMRKIIGDPDIIQIRKRFSNSCDAIKWESRVLRRLDASRRDDFLNLQNGSGEISPENNELIKKLKSIKMLEYWTEERKKIKSDNMKRYYSENPLEIERLRKNTLEMWKNKTQDELSEFSEKMKNINYEKKDEISKKLKDKWKENDFRNKMKHRNHGSNSLSLKEKWKDPVWRDYMLQCRKRNRKLKNETN
jgi:hypothetical protein